MLRTMLAATVLGIAALAATSATAGDWYRGGCPSYRSYSSHHRPSYHHHHDHHYRSHYYHRNSHHWDMYRDYIRHQSRYYRSHRPYHHHHSHHGIGIQGRNFSLHFGF